MFNVQEKKHGIELSLKKPTKNDIIVDQWDTIQRIVISLQERTNAIIYFNSKILSLLLSYFGQRGDDKNLKLADEIMHLITENDHEI